MEQITLDSTALDELNSADTRTLFDTADKLSALGVGRIVNLPQIIVVGDQSSGKSSVLEAISHVHFPVQAGICTRFATELVLRPGSRQCVTASIQFADSSRPGHSLQVADFNQGDIDKIISDARDEMGISATGRDFSKDVLRLEIQGPEMYPLTLVDLPGIFHTSTSTQSSEGRATVMELVESYMRKSNSIILTVIAASNQLANQIVLEEAAKHDPTKTRTLGVITKPDLLALGSPMEQEYLRIVRGREAFHNLGLGWHVLRNRGDNEADLGPRDTVEEQFLRSGAWGSIPTANRGVAALRAKLSRTLLDHIKKSLPSVLQDIEEKLFDREGELSRLGQPRNTPEDMRAYLLDIAGSFQRLVDNGIQGHYNDPFFGGLNGTRRKLRSKLRNFNRAIRHVLLASGSAQKVIGGPFDAPQQLSTPEYLEEYLEIYNSSLPRPEVVTWAELSADLEGHAAENQGTELPGYPNMNIVMQLFQKQSKPWERIAQFHHEEVTKVVKIFVYEAFEQIVGPPSSNNTTDAILLGFVDRFFEAKGQLLSAKVQELLRPFTEGYARPLDDDFREAMEKKAAELATSASASGSDTEEQRDDTSLSQSSDDFGSKRIIYTMHTFYDVSLTLPGEKTG